MIDNGPVSDTFQPIDDKIDFSGHYSDVQLLASTATARIYRVCRAGKTMLLKTPVDSSGRLLDLLKREYRLGVGMTHPYVAAIYTWEENSPVGPGILMEYVDGRTLARFLAERPAMKARRRAFEQLLEAANYIHLHGVTHNDLKPGNIMISRVNNDVKIIDFGLADVDGETVRRQLGGTPGYASPELAVRDASADARSDIYSIGVIMRDIFGNRYRRFWRKCIASKPRRRYRNIDGLVRAWRRRRIFPWITAAIAVLLIMAGAVAWEAEKIHNYRAEVERYSDASRQMADSLSALRQSHAASTDSLTRLNARLAAINHEKAVVDSLTRVYFHNCETIKKKYVALALSKRCIDDALVLVNQYYAEIDRNDTLFLHRNPGIGRIIYNQYCTTIRMRGAQEIVDVANRLPRAQDIDNAQ